MRARTMAIAARQISQGYSPTLRERVWGINAARHQAWQKRRAYLAKVQSQNRIVASSPAQPAIRRIAKVSAPASLKGISCMKQENYTLSGSGLGAYIQPPSRAAQLEFLAKLDQFEAEVKRMTELTEQYTYKKMLELGKAAAIYNAAIPAIQAGLNAEANRWLSDRALALSGSGANQFSLSTEQGRLLTMIALGKKMIADYTAQQAAEAAKPAPEEPEQEPQVVTVVVEKEAVPVAEKKFPVEIVAIAGAGIALLIGLKMFKIF